MDSDAVAEGGLICSEFATTAHDLTIRFVAFTVFDCSCPVTSRQST